MFKRLVEDEEQPQLKQSWFNLWSKIDLKVVLILISFILSSLVVFVLILFAGSTKRTVKPSTITCGQRPGNFQRPWLADVYFRKDFGWERPVVMGTILNPRYVLTPAYAYSHYSEFGARVLLGELEHPHTVNESYFSNRTYRDVIRAESEVHDNFEFGTRKFNLALLRLDKDIEFNDRIQPICLPNAHPQPPQRFRILPDVTDANSSVSRVDFSRCSREWRWYGFHDSPDFAESHACVKMERDGDHCYGIEGSPLLGSFRSQGVERFVQYEFKYFGDCTNGLQIYTNVSYHLEWILERIKV